MTNKVPEWAHITSTDPTTRDLGGHRIRLGTAGGRTYASEDFRPVLVLGPQRSYKTSGFAVPSLLEWEGPALVTSVRRDILDQTYHHRSKVGKVHVFDPAGSLRNTPYNGLRHSWDILYHCKDWDESVRTGRSLTEARGVRGLSDADFWFSLAAQLIAPHLFAAARSGQSMRKVVEWIKTQEEFEVRSILQGTGNEASVRAAESVWQREDKAKSSVYSTAESALRVFDYESLSVDEAPFLDIDRFLASPSDTLYICAPPDQQEEYCDVFTALVRTVISGAYTKNLAILDSLADAALERKDSAQEQAEKLCPLLVLLDEAGNIAALDNLSTLATTAAGTHIQLVSIFHDLSQMQGVYTIFPARSIVNNHSALMVLPGSRDDETLGFVENLLRGERIANTQEGTWNSPRYIRSLERGTALLIYENTRPIVLRLRSLFNNEKLKKLSQGE